MKVDGETSKVTVKELPGFLNTVEGRLIVSVNGATPAVPRRRTSSSTRRRSS